MILLVVILVLGFVFYATYVSVISKKNKVQEAFSSIDVQLKKRYDLIPNLLTTAQKYMDYEKGLLTEITELRTKAMALPDGIANINQKIDLDKQITQKLGQLNVAMENYPDLKSEETVIFAMKSMNEVEEYISAARRFYNSVVVELKNAIEIFPSSLVATMLNIQPVAFFEVEQKEREAIDVNNYLK